MKYYPVLLNLYEKTCLVVGGGNVAARKVISLLECGARVRLVCPQITAPLLDGLVKEKKIEYLRKNYDSSDLENVFLVISATDSEDVNRRVAGDCMKAGKLVNVVDDPQRCSFIVPAVVRRESLTIAVSTEGKSPLLASKIRERLEKEFDPAYSEILKLLGELRKKVLKEIDDQEKRREIFNSMLDEKTMKLLEQKRYTEVKERIKNAYCSAGDKP